VNWGLVALEVAVGATLVAASGGLLAAPIGGMVGSAALGMGLAYGSGGERLYAGFRARRCGKEFGDG